MLNRRRFVQSLIVAAASPAVSVSCRADDPRLAVLRPDPQRLLDLPDGFSYDIVSRAGDTMSDGLKVPTAHDGMAAFSGEDGRVILICNHEMDSGYPEYSAFGTTFASQPESVKARVYDLGAGITPGAGGTTTTVYNPATRKSERQHLSLAGTETNCAGGPTPWGSWLSCEECFESPGTAFGFGRKTIRDEPHGYVFEVPASETGLVEPIALKAMGRFEHEAAAVHEPSGIVYLTEDRHHSLFYRFIPETPGVLRNGGRLQALAIDDQPSMNTHNWSRRRDVEVGAALPTRWIDLDNVNPVENNLRLRGAAQGAATFARGEGICVADDVFVFTCTIGGPARLGQVFQYRPSPNEGQDNEQDEPGQLTLIAESSNDSLLKNGDTLTMAPWGDLIVCEDTSDHCGLVGIRPDGTQYAIAENAYSNSEMAGACFSPDGKILFVNIQYPGITFAITGPWPL
jgi:secreted PhoX family phosphatase